MHLSSPTSGPKLPTSRRMRLHASSISFKEDNRDHQRIGQIPHLLSGEKEQNVAFGLFAQVDLDDGAHCRFEIVSFWLRCVLKIVVLELPKCPLKADIVHAELRTKISTGNVRPGTVMSGQSSK